MKNLKKMKNIQYFYKFKDIFIKLYNKQVYILKKYMLNWSWYTRVNS